MKPTVAIFKHDPECSDVCVHGIITALGGEFHTKTFGEDEFNADTFEDVDILAFPGGIGDADRYYDFFKRREGNAVADFVSRGGKYLGICMGAYWAGRNYFDLLDDLEPVQYIKSSNADIRRPYGTVAKVTWQGNEHTMFFYDGCTFVGEGRCQIFARYKNDDPMAIIQRRVGLIGCHPESELSWYDQFKYVRKFWHEGKHHDLLLDFTKKLMRAK
jgi:glutamine amidotransferase-like uncharacterized protein